MPILFFRFTIILFLTITPWVTIQSYADNPPTMESSDISILKTLVLPQDAHPPKDITNCFADNPDAAALGKKLFFDKRFSGMLTEGDNDGSPNTLGKKGETQRVSCSGCHIPDSAFTDTRTIAGQVSLAAGWGRRKAISLLDVAQNKLLMWDGRKDSFQSQIFSVIESPVEMNSSRLFVAQQVARYYKTEYEKLFGPLPPLLDPKEFPILSDKLTGCQPSTVDPLPLCNGTQHGMPGDHAEYDHLSVYKKDQVTRVVLQIGKAIGAYLRGLSCGPSRFDAFMNGNSTALNPSEQRGALLFIGKAKCIQCHTGPYFSDQKFHNVGLIPVSVGPAAFIDADDKGAADGLSQLKSDPLNSLGRFSSGYDGRIQAYSEPEMMGAFMTPMLRCIKNRPSFFHTGQISTLDGAIEFFNRGGDRSGLYPGKSEITPLNLTKEEIGDIKAFLFSLEGPGAGKGIVVTTKKWDKSNY